MREIEKTGLLDLGFAETPAASYGSWKQAETAREALAIIRGKATSDAEMGLQFEELFSVVALNAPDLQVENIYRLSEWPSAPKHGLDGRDIGVDRVAILKTGEIVAVQCKCYGIKNKVGKDDIKKFLSGSQNKVFDLRWLVTTSDLNDVAWRMISNTNIKHLDFQQFYNYSITGKPAAPRQPWKLQQEAIETVIEGFSNPDNIGRGRLIMACGTGKTFTALRIAERLVPDGGQILFLAPSIALVGQARKEWLTHTQRLLSCTVVCSDKTIARGDSISLREFSFSVTTNAEHIAERLKVPLANGVSVTFCTYQSLSEVTRAQKEYGAPAFDLALVDEAHRTAGLQNTQREPRLFQRIHYQDEVACSKRLYMTATPRIYGESSVKRAQSSDANLKITDMNNSEVYGPRFYHLTFRQAVNAGMLCDVRVICLGLSEEVMENALLRDEMESISDATHGQGSPAGVQEYLAALVIGLALNGWVEGSNRAEIPKSLPKTIGYANSIRRSKWLAAVLQSETVQGFLQNYQQRKSETKPQEEVRTIFAQHLDGSNSAHERNREINTLNMADTNEARVITNCRLFTEGVDVPNLSSVAFMDPRSSATDIIQAIGRVMRKGEQGKVFGYIIVPFSLTIGESVSEALSRRASSFSILGKVLRALQSHDEELRTKLPEMVIINNIEEDEQEESKGGGGSNIVKKDQDDDDAHKIAEQLYLEDPDSIYAFIAKYSGLGNPGKLVADIIIIAVKRAARIFIEEKAAITVAETLGASAEFIESLDEKERDAKLNEASHTAALIIANACLMHKRLEATGSLGNLHKLEKMGSKADVMALLLEDWHAILEKDYKPIFGQALMILHYLSIAHPHKVQLQAAMHNLINCAVDTSESLNELGYDHAGPLYHTILENASSQGAFYTKNQSALLMSKLVFSDTLLDWGDPAKVSALRVIDPCCGTGTLLMAGLNAIKQKAAHAQQLDKQAVQGLHKALVERCFYGLDITSQAVQLAACNLTLGAPDTQYERMNIYSLEYGMAHGESTPAPATVRHGALELLNQMDFAQKSSQGSLDIGGIVQPLSSTSVIGKNEELELPGSFDVVMMNPPFTDTSRQKGQFSEVVGTAMAKRLRTLSSELQSKSAEAHGALGKMSVRPFFTPLADQLINRESGTLAQIIPTTALTSHNGMGERRYLAKHFHIETVVTSHDPKNIAFSASTGIHESMMVARRKTDKSAPTRFIQLARMPANTKEVDELVQSIQSGNLGSWGSCTLWPTEKVQAGDWSAVQWYAGELADAVEYIGSLDGLAISSAKYSWSPGGREFRGTFDYKSGTPNADGQVNAFCSIAETRHRTLASTPDTWAHAKATKKLQAERLMARGGHVLVPCRVDTVSGRMFAVYSKTATIGSAFRPIDSAAVISAERAKAYTVFLNSTFGVLQLLNMRTRKLTYPAYETGHLETLRLPIASTTALQPLIALFDKLCTQELERLAHAHNDPVRLQLDHAVAQLLGVKPAQTDRWRALLAEEPTISNRRAGG